LLIKKLKDLKKPSFKILEDLFKKYAIAAVITKDENDLLNKAKLRTLTISDENIWKRYNNKDVQIKIKNNPLNNDFFKYHIAKMEEAKVFDKN
jgi:soluble P-type ATPase